MLFNVIAIKTLSKRVEKKIIRTDIRYVAIKRRRDWIMVIVAALTVPENSHLFPSQD